MLFVVVEAIQHLDNIKDAKTAAGDDNDETEINTLEFVRDNFEEKLQTIETLNKIIGL